MKVVMALICCQWLAPMTGSMSFFTTLWDSLLACHKRKRSAGVSLNFVR